jgi:putative membrane protein
VRINLRFYISLFIIIILLIVAFIFGSQNDQLMTLNYLVAQNQITVAFAVSLFTFIGFILGVFTTLLWRFYRILQRKKRNAA